MTDAHKKFLSFVGVILIVVGGFYIYKYASEKQMQKLAYQSALASAKEIITDKKDCAQALPMLVDLMQTDDTYAEVWYWQGYCLLDLGDVKTAKVSFEKALKLDPQMTLAQESLYKLTPKATSISAPMPINKKDYGANPPKGLPSGLVAKPTEVLESYTDTIPADATRRTSERAEMFFNYKTTETLQKLSSSFQAYLKVQGYEVKSQSNGKITAIIAQTSQKGCVIKISSATNAKQTVDIQCWTIVKK